MGRLYMADDRGPSGQVQMVTVGENHDGQRLDNFLLARLKGCLLYTSDAADECVNV